MTNSDEKLEKALAPLLTDEFLETLFEAACVCGWTIDFIETASFVEWCYELAEKDCPKFRAYDLDDPKVDIDRIVEKLGEIKQQMNLYHMS